MIHQLFPQANVTIISRDKCNFGSGKYNGAIRESMICAGIPNVGGKDTCLGDSKGPMVGLINGDGLRRISNCINILGF